MTCINNPQKQVYSIEQTMSIIGTSKHKTITFSTSDPRGLLSGPDTTLESHLIVFAAEQARREHQAVDGQFVNI